MMWGLAPVASAGTADDGLVSNIYINTTGVVLFYSDGTRAGLPACTSTYSNRFGFDGTTPAGKNLLAALLAAHASGGKVAIVGTNSCDFFASETVSYLYVR
jgi:hypothetical protein